MTLSWLAGGSLVLLGVAGLIWAKPAATFYGVALDDRAALTFVRSTAARDVALGCILWAACSLGDRHVVASVLMATGVVPFADACLVASHAGLKRKLPLAIHVSGVVGVLATAWLVSKGI